MTSAATLDCLVLHADADPDRDWTTQLVGRLGGVNVDARTCPISTDPGWLAAFERRLIEAGAVLLVGTGPAGIADLDPVQLTAARLLRAAGRKPVLDLVVPGSAQADHEVELPRHFDDAGFETSLRGLVAAMRSPAPRPTLVLVLAQNDRHFQAARQALTAGAVAQRYGNNLLCWSASGSAMTVVNSRQATGNPPAELLQPDVVVVQGDAEPAGTPAQPGAVAVGTPAWSRFGAGPDAREFATVARDLADGRVRCQEVDLGAPGSAQRRSGALLVPLGEAEAEALRNLRLRVAVVAAAGATPAEAAGTARDLANALAGTAWHQARTIVGLLGFGDRPTSADSLNRTALVTVLADVLTDATRTGAAEQGDASGPTVVTLEGPWGSGKSSMLHRLGKTLTDRRKANEADDKCRTGRIATGRPLRVCGAARQLRRSQPAGSSAADIKGGGEVRQPLVVTFNPWSHHLGEEIWAGLSNAVQAAVTKQLCVPAGKEEVDDNRRERYWFRRNIRHVDRRRLAMELQRRIVSPLFKISLYALVVPVLAQVVNKDLPVRVPWLGISLSPPRLLLVVGLVLLVAGAAHTSWRFFLRRASNYLPPDLFHAPVLTGSLLTTTAPADGSALLDPLSLARAGRLALWQQNLGETADDLKAANCTLIVFIDDLDRCSPERTTAMFEAMNDLMSGDDGRIRFVMAVDTAVLAAHLSQSFADTGAVGAAVTLDDPDIGWAFLRKLVQLPIIVPAIGASSRRDLLDALLGGRPAGARTTAAGVGAKAAPAVSAPAPRGETQESESRLTPEEVERDPVFGELLLDRLEQRPAITVRELKRLLTVWQFYLRTLGEQDRLAGRPAVDAAEYVRRARNVFILAEIVTRWPSLQAKLHSQAGGRRVLTRLAEVAATRPAQWDACWWELKLPTKGSGPAMSAALRKLLETYRGAEVAAVAERLL